MNVKEETIEIPSDLDLALGVQLRVFDPQMCDHVDLAWLKNAVECAGIPAAEVDSLVTDGIVCRWKSPKGKEGFLIYSERQVRVAKALRDSGRYTTEELRHFFADWNIQIEICQQDILTYDRFDISDYEHFQRRSAEEAAHCKWQRDRLAAGEADWMEEHQRKTTNEQFSYWTKWNRVVTSREDEELSHQTRLNWRRALAHLRWVDEFTRAMGVDNVGKLLERGFSSEVTFNGHKESGEGTEFYKLSWAQTLERFKETINEGHDFPLRMPDFTITRQGIVFSNFPTPNEVKGLEETYHLDQLRKLLAKWGTSLWECDLAASGRAECAECRKPFERTKASRKYCSEICRNRSKARRYRENNPEKVDAARARYYD